MYRVDMECTLFFWIVAIHMINCGVYGEDSVCTAVKTCADCISASHTCAWCMQPDYDDDNLARCDDVTNLKANGCEERYVVNPGHQEIIVKNIPPRDSDPSRDSEPTRDAIQLAPQEVVVNLRPNVPYQLNITFRQANNYPVDLYYIMDLSNTMLKSKRQVANLGNELAIQMRNITANFKLGFGSYIDKPTCPYISIEPQRLKDPCRTTVCVPTYAFKNHLPLTFDAHQFTDVVRQSRISGNLDTPEGTFDAMMQAVACKDRIGWRAVSRKILLVSTDNIYHYAGDGKLAGIVKPNDGECHLNDENEYNMSLYQDYPSISHLASKVSEQNINVIFAIIDRLNALSAYRPLTSLIPASVVVKLGEDSGNIVEVIKENYKRISGKVELKHNAPDGVHVSFSTSCLGDTKRNVSVCDGLRVGDSVTFTMTLNVTGCPSDVKDRQKTVTVYPVGLSDKLTLRVNIECACPCERKDFTPIGDVSAPVNHSSQCSEVGTYQCGVCMCEPGWYGKTCSCRTDSDKFCKSSNSAELCSGHGTCVCGSCLCDPVSPSDPSKVYTGQYCECNDYNCDYYMGQLCGGPERGQCVCGQCHCRREYTGSSCDCSTSTDSCVGRNKLVCSGHGKCVCGQCVCDDQYQGTTCAVCPSCPGQCEVNKACVQCATFGTGPFSESECAANCSHVNTVTEINKDDTTDKLVCTFRDEDNCDFYFTYSFDTLQVFAQRHKECPKPVNKIGIILGVVGVITVVGIIVIIIWKIIVTIYDRKEYEKFVREREVAKWQVEGNPIYKPSTSTFKNPAFDKVK